MKGEQRENKEKEAASFLWTENQTMQLKVCTAYVAYVVSRPGVRYVINTWGNPLYPLRSIWNESMLMRRRRRGRGESQCNYSCILFYLFLIWFSRKYVTKENELESGLRAHAAIFEGLTSTGNTF